MIHVRTSIVLFLAAMAPSLVGSGEVRDAVTRVRLPDGGIQPQVAVDSNGVAHVVYFKGEPGNGDLLYARLDKSGAFSAPIRVNSEPASAIATGNVRGAHLAIGRNGRVHVAWNGSSCATPRAPGDATPMLFTRMNVARTAFEPQRNLLHSSVGLDGGGAIAADANGRVFVAWHLGDADTKGEGDRRVWLSTSTDDGATFSRERAISSPETGACGCCGMAAAIDREGALSLLYRSARDLVHRDTYLLRAPAGAGAFTSTKLEEWNIGACPMSTFSLLATRDAMFAAWETAGQVQFTRITKDQASAVIEAPGALRTRKHPVLASNERGEVLFAWTEGMAWQRGGNVAWQLYDASGRALGGPGRALGVPVWGLIAAFSTPNGFMVAY